MTGMQLSRFEKKHRTVGGNAIRAAVLGGNVVLAGVAGLLAGVLSMALGEWISVKSSQELYENQMLVEMQEIETNPEGEKREIALIYMSKGIPEAQAIEMAAALMEDKSQAHAMLVNEELGINPDELKGSALEAAVYSFILFSIGAIIPLSPFLFTKGPAAIIISVIVSTLGLFLIGVAITLFTGRSFWFSGLRQVLFGLAAAVITFIIGRLIGANIG